MHRITKRQAFTIGGVIYAKCENCHNKLPECYEEDRCSVPIEALSKLAAYEDLEERMDKEQTKCAICNGGLPCDNGCDGFCDICDIPDVWKTIHKTGQYNYCPICGKRLTARKVLK
jgi:hypothetical protein